MLSRLWKKSRKKKETFVSLKTNNIVSRWIIFIIHLETWNGQQILKYVHKIFLCDIFKIYEHYNVRKKCKHTCTLLVENYMFMCPVYQLWTTFKDSLNAEIYRKYHRQLSMVLQKGPSQTYSSAQVVQNFHKMGFAVYGIILQPDFHSTSHFHHFLSAKILLPRKDVLSLSPLQIKGISRTCWATYFMK